MYRSVSENAFFERICSALMKLQFYVALEILYYISQCANCFALWHFYCRIS